MLIPRGDAQRSQIFDHQHTPTQSDTWPRTTKFSVLTRVKQGQFSNQNQYVHGGLTVPIFRPQHLPTAYDRATIFMTKRSTGAPRPWHNGAWASSAKTFRDATSKPFDLEERWQVIYLRQLTWRGSMTSLQIQRMGKICVFRGRHWLYWRGKLEITVPGPRYGVSSSIHDVGTRSIRSP